MTQQPDYLRYLESAKQAELASQLREEGFVVELDKKIGDLSFDLVAKQGERAIAYEVRSVGGRRIDKAAQRRLQELAKRSGMEFRIVIVNPPPRVRVEIEDLTTQLKPQLQDYIINEAFPDELDSLSTHTRVSGVADIEISDIHIGSEETRITGTGTVDVELQYGSGLDSSSPSLDAFPFYFKAILSPGGQLTSVEELTVDTSMFY